MHKPAKAFAHPAQRSKEMRDRAMSVALKRKEEYLGARVPKALKEKVILRADELGIPVSLLLRKVLEEVFAEEQTILKLDLIKNAKKNSKEEPKKSYDEVLAWKEIQLNKAKECDSCGESMPAGSLVMMGIASSNINAPILCKACQQGVIKQKNA